MKTNLSSSSISTIDKGQNISPDNRSTSPCSSPRSSPKPSPRPQTKRDHSKSDTFLTVNYNKDQVYQRQDGSPSSQESGSRISQESGSRERLSSANIEITPPQDCISVSGKDKRERTKKKSSWFNSFYPTYKSRSEDFKKLFKKVPDDERLVVDYSCALQKEILVQGRIYVTQNYLCFHANIFGWETNLTLKWKDVASIAKEKTALVIPNAILISTKSDRYFFTSFVSRDKTYVMLFRVWQNALMDQPMSAQEMWQWVHQSYGSELGLTSDDEDYIAPTGEEDKLSVRLSVESFSESRAIRHWRLSEARGIIEGIMDPERDGDETGFSTSKVSGSESHIPTDVTDNSDSDHERIHHPPQKKKMFTRSHPKPHLTPAPDSEDPDLNKFMPLQNVQCTVQHEGRQLLDVVVPIHIDQLFTLLFTSSKFYLDFHAARKTTDLTQTAWTHNPIDNSKSRIVSLTMALGQTVGPKSAQVTETQTMHPCSKAGHLYSIDIETINAGVPYADSFVVLAHYCLRKISDTQSSLNIYAQIKYKKSVWGLVKGMIERNCFSGMEDYINHLARALNSEGEAVPEIKRKSRRKRRLYLPRSPSEDTSCVPLRKKSHTSEGIFHSDACTLIVFSVLLLLLLLNIMLYYKLWSLEETPTYPLLDLHILKNPPQNHEEWLQLLQKQESLHNLEAQKWQKLLKNSLEYLRQAEESLNELKRSIQTAYSSKLSILQNDEQKPEEIKEL